MPTANNVLADHFTRHTVDLDRVSADLRRKAIQQLKKLEKDLVAQLRAAELGDAPPLTMYKSARLTALLEQTQATIKSYYIKAKDAHQEALKDLADIETQAAVKITNNALGTSVMSVSMNEETLTHIVNRTLIEGSPSKEWWARQAGNTRARFEDAVRSGLLQGLTTEEIVQKVRGTKAKGFADGIMAVSRRNAEALVRSSVMAVANAARIETYQRNEDLFQGLQWHSTLDGRTSDICKSRSGLMYNTDGTPQGHDKILVGPPAHWNCRSTLVPVLKSWDDLAGPNASPVKTGQSQGQFDNIYRNRLAAKGFNEEQIANAMSKAQASMDGVVPEVWDYERWLKSKSKDFQVEILGPGRYELWKEGKLTFAELTDNYGNPLTLTQLRERVG